MLSIRNTASFLQDRSVPALRLTFYVVAGVLLIWSVALDPRGRPVTASALDAVQYAPYVVEDESGGALVAWVENEPGAWGELPVQRMLADGAIDEG